MTTQNNSITDPANRKRLLLRMLIGGLIALTLMIVFLSGVPNGGKPEWGDYWKIRPLIVITFAGATGGLIFHLMEPMRKRGTGLAIMSYFLSLIIYVFGLWMGTVLGLNGTLWN